MNNKFDWTLIQSFLGVLDHGSLLAAARALGSSQPTVGRHVAELEAQLNTVLFERTGRGLTPTAAAQAIGEAARDMESGALGIGRALAKTSGEAAGTVRISASQPVACELLPGVLARMRQALPAIQVEVVSSNAVTNLLRREADIAIRMVRPEQASLIARKIGEVTIGAYAHADYLRQRGAPRVPEDLFAHDLIGNDTDDTILRGMRALGYTGGKELFALRSDDQIFHWQAIRAGAGIGFISAYIARRDPNVVQVLPALPIPPLPVWLTVHREIRASRRIRQVYDFLAQAIPTVIE
jgi:DNA-binding transcriptional LysR family regulator